MTTTMADTPSERNLDVLRYYYEFARDRGRMPTLREASKHFGMTSPNGVHSHLRALARIGWIRARPHKTFEFVRTPDGRAFDGFAEKGESHG